MVFNSHSKNFANSFQIIPGLVEICHLLLVINSSLNFPIYFMASGSRFRDIVSCWRLGESSPVSYSSTFMYSTSTLMIPLQVWPPTSSPQLSYNSIIIPPMPSCCLSPIIHKKNNLEAQPASLFPSSNNSFVKPAISMSKSVQQM